MSKRTFYTPEEIRSLYSEIVPAYQVAFEGPPWNEVSKCVDKQMRCIGGLSSLAVGAQCDTCGLCPMQPAYEVDELTQRFDALGALRKTAWYVERNELGLAMAAVAWKASPLRVAAEKYTDVPEMSDWMAGRLGAEPIMWLDEVFANSRLRPSGNLRNFGELVMGLASVLECSTVAYRTIEPRMTTVATRDFADNAVILERSVDVPDRRDFVVISNLAEVI